MRYIHEFEKNGIRFNKYLKCQICDNDDFIKTVEIPHCKLNCRCCGNVIIFDRLRFDKYFISE